MNLASDVSLWCSTLRGNSTWQHCEGLRWISFS